MDIRGGGLLCVLGAAAVGKRGQLVCAGDVREAAGRTIDSLLDR